MILDIIIINILYIQKKDRDEFTTIAKGDEHNFHFTINFSNNPTTPGGSNIVTFYNFLTRLKGTIYKLKGSGIKETIFTVTGLNEVLTANEGEFNIFDVIFAQPNINSGIYYSSENDLSFELSVIN